MTGYWDGCRYVEYEEKKVEISNSLKKRFVKDNKLPITLYNEPYFSRLLEFYEGLFPIKERWNQFLALVEKYGGQDGYFLESARISDEIQAYIKSKPEYIDFNTCIPKSDTFKKWFDYKPAIELQTETIYQRKNAENYFIALDLTHANFNCLRLAHPNIVGGAKTWKEFVNNWTDEKYFHKSKHIRQVIFGHLNPKRQMRFQQKIVNDLLDQLLQIGIPESMFVSRTHDELVLKLDSGVSDESLIGKAMTLEMDITNKVRRNFPTFFSIEAFRLKQIGDKPYFVKEFVLEERPVELKGVPAHFFAECYRHYLGQDPQEDDRVTYHEKRLAKFLEPLFPVRENYGT